ncbi:unnamed protein product [Discosporangium mesarthrocarpum]
MATLTAPSTVGKGAGGNEVGVTETQASKNGESQGDRHPLQNRWTLWFDNSKLKKATETWEENLKPIMSFDVVEDFWGLFNNIMPPSMLTAGSNYSVFKDGVKPMWEDKANAKGGKFVLTVDRREAGNLDEWWLHAVLAAIGEILEVGTGASEEAGAAAPTLGGGGAEVCGVVVSVRKGQHRIALWTSSCEESRVVPAGRKLKEALKLPVGLKFKFQTHDEALSSLSSFQNNAYFEV